IRLRILGPDHRFTNIGKNYLANIYFNQGRYEEARKLYEECLANHRRVFGPEDLETLESTLNRISTYSTLGRHANAEIMGRNEAQLAQLGLKHPDTWVIMVGVASNNLAQGRSAGALMFSRQAAEIGEKLDRADSKDQMLLYILAC